LKFGDASPDPEPPEIARIAFGGGSAYSLLRFSLPRLALPRPAGRGQLECA
jgi:hypothetical protein